jgi:hypothetical protein
MKKTTIIAISLFVVLVGILSSCAKAQTTLSPATYQPAVSPTSTAATLQSGLPLSVTEPADAATINGDTVTVQGNTIAGATVSVNGMAVIADTSGAFSATVSLDDGPNAIDVIVTGANGNQGEVLLMVNAVASASATPSVSPDVLPLTVTEPADSATLTTTTVTVKGQTAPEATVTVNGITDLADSSGYFSIDVNLNDGANAIDVVAIGDNGAQNEVTLMVNVTPGL